MCQIGCAKTVQTPPEPSHGTAGPQPLSRLKAFTLHLFGPGGHWPVPSSPLVLALGRATGTGQGAALIRSAETRGQNGPVLPPAGGHASLQGRPPAWRDGAVGQAGAPRCLRGSGESELERPAAAQLALGQEVQFLVAPAGAPVPPRPVVRPMVAGLEGDAPAERAGHGVDRRAGQRCSRYCRGRPPRASSTACLPLPGDLATGPLGGSVLHCTNPRQAKKRPDGQAGGSGSGRALVGFRGRRHGR